MAQSNHLSDVLSEINPLVNDIMNYELRLRGIQPAQAPTTKKVQLARELLKEKQGEGYTIMPFMSLAEDLRCCASLFAQFDSMINCATRTTLSIETALINLAFLKIRVERLNSSSNSDTISIDMLSSNITNAIQKGKQMLEFSQNAMREEVNDFIGTNEQLNFQPLFASMSLNDPNEPRATHNPTTDNVFVHTNNNNSTNQSRFNQHVPLSSTDTHLNHPEYHVNFDQNLRNENFPNPTQNFNRHFNENSNINLTCNNFQRQNPNPNRSENVPNFNENLRYENHYHSNPNHTRNFQPQNTQNFYANPNGSIHTPRRYDHKMYKWNVKFSGENQKYDAIDFIQKVNAIAQSRGVTDSELFASAIEFFSGQALKWYYAQRNQIKSWSELAEKLISDFIEVNYHDNLLDTIRQRQQTSNESIVHFVTIFEDDCSRLQTLMLPKEQIHIVKKNVLQKYRPHISLKHYNTLNELKQDLKLLEASMMSTNDRNVSFTAGTSTHTSRYDSHRGNRSYSRSPSNSSNATHTNQNSPSRFGRPATPIPYERNRNTSYDRTQNRNKSPYNDKHRNESYDRNKNATRSNSRDSNASQQQKSPKNLNR